jgi:hypothetical protein
MSLAKELGAVLVRPVRDLHSAVGEVVPGKATALFVSVVGAGITAVETPAFGFDDRKIDSGIMVGTFLLAQLDATLEIGCLTIGQTRRNPGGFEITDWSGVRAPLSISWF